MKKKAYKLSWLRSILIYPLFCKTIVSHVLLDYICALVDDTPTFQVLDQKEAAKQWGLCKKRTKMTFDKFSRSMRFYYSKGILVHNPDKRLTYIFCRQPHDPVYTEMLERVMNTLPPNTLHCTAT